MQEKETNELEKVLGKTHLEEFDGFVQEYRDSLLSDSTSFCAFIKEIMKRNGVTQQDVFLRADLPERYGYKLLSGEKRTRQRDVVIRLCYAAELTLPQTQRALKKYEMAELYAKNPRDALLMLAFNERPGSIIDVNTLLKQNNLSPLRTSGSQD